MITCFNKITSRPSTRPSKLVIHGLVSPADVIPTSLEPSLRLILASRNLLHASLGVSAER